LRFRQVLLAGRRFRTELIQQRLRAQARLLPFRVAATS
jgi:hypothetical protein